MATIGFSCNSANDRNSSWLATQTHLTPCGRIFRTTWHTVALILSVSPGWKPSRTGDDGTNAERNRGTHVPLLPLFESLQGKWNTRLADFFFLVKCVSECSSTKFRHAEVVPTRCLHVNLVRVLCIRFCLPCLGVSVVFCVILGQELNLFARCSLLVLPLRVIAFSFVD